MHENEITDKVIGAAIEVHKALGPGLLESVYEEALCHELSLRNIRYQRQQPVPLDFKGKLLESKLRLDLIVEEKVIVELKAKEQLSAVDKPQLLTYLRLSKLRLGLLINFHAELLKDGIYRVANHMD